MSEILHLALVEDLYAIHYDLLYVVSDRVASLDVFSNGVRHDLLSVSLGGRLLYVHVGGEIVVSFAVLGLFFVGVDETVVLEAVLNGVREGRLAELRLRHIDVVFELLDLRENDALPALQEVELFVQLGGLLKVLNDEFVFLDQEKLLLVLHFYFLSQGLHLLLQYFVLLFFEHVEIVVMVSDWERSLHLVFALNRVAHLRGDWRRVLEYARLFQLSHVVCVRFA